MKIGYSFWGFLGNGITNTPDGGRSHRRTLIDGLAAKGHEIVFMQPDRDLIEAATDLTDRYVWDAGLPEVDALILEWRWPIPGRNTTWCGAAGHTCDLHRQEQLIAHYTAIRQVPTIIWDKDRKLPDADALRRVPHVSVCEPALHPTPGAVSLLFPVADQALDAADPVALSQLHRSRTLVYVGNQYERDHVFDQYFVPAATVNSHLVAGKWQQVSRWPKIRFRDRVPFDSVEGLHRSSLATVLLLPDRYAASGHITQRLFESVLAGCAPVTPSDVRSRALFTPYELHAQDGDAVARICRWLVDIAGTDEHAHLIARCLRYLDLFRISRQIEILEKVLLGTAVPTS